MCVHVETKYQEICLQVLTFCIFVARSYAEMETDREKSATPTRDYAVPSSSAAAAVGGEKNYKF